MVSGLFDELVVFGFERLLVGRGVLLVTASNLIQLADKLLPFAKHLGELGRGSVGRLGAA